MTPEPKGPDHVASTTPAPVRAARALSGPALAFDLAREADRLRSEEPWSQHGRNAVTLVKYPDLRIVFILMRPGSRLQEHHAGATISIHTLSGHVRVHLKDDAVELHAGRLLALERDVPHDVEAVDESAVLLTIAWAGA